MGRVLFISLDRIPLKVSTCICASCQCAGRLPPFVPTSKVAAFFACQASSLWGPGTVGLQGAWDMAPMKVCKDPGVCVQQRWNRPGDLLIHLVPGRVGGKEERPLG